MKEDVQESVSGADSVFTFAASVPRSPTPPPTRHAPETGDSGLAAAQPQHPNGWSGALPFFFNPAAQEAFDSLQAENGRLVAHVAALHAAFSADVSAIRESLLAELAAEKQNLLAQFEAEMVKRGGELADEKERLRADCVAEKQRLWAEAHQHVEASRQAADRVPGLELKLATKEVELQGLQETHHLEVESLRSQLHEGAAMVKAAERTARERFNSIAELRQQVAAAEETASRAEEAARAMQRRDLLLQRESETTRSPTPADAPAVKEEVSKTEDALRETQRAWAVSQLKLAEAEVVLAERDSEISVLQGKLALAAEQSCDFPPVVGEVSHVRGESASPEPPAKEEPRLVRDVVAIRRIFVGRRRSSRPVRRALRRTSDSLARPPVREEVGEVAGGFCPPKTPTPRGPHSYRDRPVLDQPIGPGMDGDNVPTPRASSPVLIARPRTPVPGPGAFPADDGDLIVSAAGTETAGRGVDVGAQTSSARVQVGSSASWSISLFLLAMLWLLCLWVSLRIERAHWSAANELARQHVLVLQNRVLPATVRPFGYALSGGG